MNRMRSFPPLRLVGMLLASTGLMPLLACRGQQAGPPLPHITAARPENPANPTRQAATDPAQTDPQEPVSNPSVICIDPGHPSEVNNGLAVQNGTTETHIDWVVSLKLKQILTKMGYKVVMTKSSERQLVKNKERALIANRAHADLMVRLHCDSSTEAGYALYYPDRQGKAQGKVGPSADIMKRSKAAAQALDAGMAKVLNGSLRNGGVRGDSLTAIGSKQGALTGSIFSEVPVVTIEMVVLSNKGDAEFIKKEDGQQQMAQAIADGIARYVPVSK